MKIHEISVSNFRKFETLSCTFHPNMTVLVAENGGGKTTLLDAVRIALWPFVKGFDLGSQTGKSATIQNEDVRLVLQENGNMESQTPSRIATKGDWLTLSDDEMIIERSQVKKNTGNASNVLTTQFTRYAKKLEKKVRDNENVDLPLISYLGTSRVWYQGRNTIQEKELILDAQDFSRTSAYLNCLSYNASYKTFAIWYTHIYQSYRESQLIAQEKFGNGLAEKLVLDALGDSFDNAIYVIKSSIDTIIKPVTGWHSIEYSVRHQRSIVMSHDELGTLPVDMLSDGVRNAIAMIADIAFRAYKLNPHLGKNAAKETAGIVMIDEVDMFLHPKWQQTILPSLQDAFPNIQFIVTTHSPQVLSTVTREKIRIVGSDDQGKTYADVPKYHPLGHDAGDSLSHIMGVSPRPKMPFDQQVIQYEQLVRNGEEESEQAKNIKTELDSMGYVFKESDLYTWRFLAQHRRNS